MTATTYTIPQVPGSKRRSDRNYSHAIIGKFNYKRAIRICEKIQENDKRNYDYYQKVYDLGIGGTFRTDDGRSWPVSEESYNHAAQRVEKYGDRETYAFEMAAQRVEDLKNQQEKEGDAFRVLRWSQSRENAMKGMAEFWENHIDLQIVETVKL